MANTQTMPCRGERGAPTFDSSQPHELEGFFADLEFLFNRCSVAGDVEKIKHAVRYLSMSDADIWMAVPEYKVTPGADWENFKKAIIKLYPSANSSLRYTPADLDSLVATRLGTGIVSVNDLAEYTRQFRGIARLLVDNRSLSDDETKRMYVRGFQPSFWMQVFGRLQIVDVNLSATPVYEIDKVYAAAEWILQASSNAGLPAVHLTSSVPFPGVPPVSGLASASPSDPYVKLEEHFSKLTECLIEALSNQHDYPPEFEDQ